MPEVSHKKDGGGWVIPRKQTVAWEDTRNIEQNVERTWGDVSCRSCWDTIDGQI